MTLNVATRAVLVAVALPVLLVPAVVALGGYVPSLPVVGRFGAFVASDLPWVTLVALAGALLVGVALRLGGGRWTRLLGVLALIVVAALVFAGVAMAKTLADHGATYDVLRQLGPAAQPRNPSERVVYATVEGRNLQADVWLPFRALNAPFEPGPAVLYVHGGGFVGGELGMRPALFTFLVNHGYVVLDVEYRLAPPPRWQDAPADVLCSLAWLGAEAEAGANRFGIDPAKVVLMGESAGGNLALLAAYAAGTGAIAPSCDGDAIEPAGVIVIAPAVDLEALWRSQTLVYEGRPLPEAYVGGPPSAYPDRYAAANPLSLVRADVPPTLLIAGGNDRIVDVEQVRRLEDALRVAGATVDLIVVPFGDHGFDGYADGPGGQLLEGIVPAFISRL